MSYVSTYGETDGFTSNATDPSYPMPLPEGFLGADYIRRPTDLTWRELLHRRVEIVNEIRQAEEYARQPPPMPPNAKLTPRDATEMALAWKNLHLGKIREQTQIEVELQLRPALAFGCLVFVLVGAPVGIWFSRADYLSAFVSCFLPTIATYYPLLLSGLNLAKEGRVPAAVGLWAANVVIGIGALILCARLLRR
jgi:lipopolysaccharide export system permease protein